MDNNIFEFPARMSDGRFITDYSPNCMLNNKYQQSMNSFEYRNYLTNNSNQIVDNINQTNNQLYSCLSCSGNLNPSSKYKLNCNEINCQLDIINKNGIALN